MNKTYLADNHEVVSNLIAALVEVTRRINLDKAAAIPILNAQLKRETGKPLNAEVIQKAMTRIELTWDPICASVKRSAEASHRIGFLRTEPRLEGLYSLSLLNDVLKDKNLPLVEGLTP